jgi:hypothetical protein
MAPLTSAVSATAGVAKCWKYETKTELAKAPSRRTAQAHAAQVAGGVEGQAGDVILVVAQLSDEDVRRGCSGGHSRRGPRTRHRSGQKAGEKVV